MFYADEISGCEGMPFTLSALMPVIIEGNKLVRYKFPFWGFSVPRNSDYGTEWIDKSRYEKEAERILKAVTEGDGLSYFRMIRTSIISAEKDFEKESRHLLPQIKKLGDKELIASYEAFMKAYTRAYGWGIVTFLYESILSEKLMISLTARYKNAASFLPQLLKSSYQSFLLRSELSLARLEGLSSNKERLRLAEKYAKDYFYIRTNYFHAPRVTLRYINERLKHMSANQEKIVHPGRVKLFHWEKKVVDLLRITEAIRDKRKQVCMIGSNVMFRFLEEAAARRGIDLKVAAKINWHEYGELVISNKIFAKLRKRHEFSAVYQKNRCLYLDYIALREKSKEIGGGGLSGTPASSGKYQGVVRLIFQSREFSSFKKGEILVTQMTRPEFLPIMKKAAAIVTDEGGLTCHAAIVAREMGIPCIVGVRSASKILQTGQIAEVDANSGIIRIIR